MSTVNKSHLIAGFFRYHREKLNYSLRGLVSNGSVVELSSLSDFEHGKRQLHEDQLVYLFKLIGYDYYEVINAYDFERDYQEIIEHIILGETEAAENKFYYCCEKGVFNSLGTLNFSIIEYFFLVLDEKITGEDFLAYKLTHLMNNDQVAILRVTYSIYKINQGLFNDSIEILNDVEKNTYNAKIQAWIKYLISRPYVLSGNYVEATISLIESKRRYGEIIGIIRMIQSNLSLGTVYSLTNSYAKAEESYLIAYERALMLKESTGLLTKCFNSLCWLYFETNEYDKVRDLLDNKPDELVESRNTYYILAWANYKLGNVEESIKYCEAGLDKFKEYSYVCMIYEYIKKACKGIKTGQDTLLKKIIETEDYDHDKLTERLFTLELINIYERRKNYEKAFKYAKKLLNR